MRFRAELRARWLAWLGLALLVGLVGGTAIAAAAGARRTESAYPRFVDSQEGYDVGFGGTGGNRDIRAESDAIAALPQVAAAVQLNLVSISAQLPDGRPLGFPDFVAFADPSGRDGYTVNRWKILQGRAPDPRRAGEAVIGFQLHDQHGINVGDVIRLRLGDPFAAASKAPIVPMRIVGIVLGPGGFPIVGSVSPGSMELTPAFARRYATQIPPDEDGPNVLLKRRGDLPAFLSSVAKIDPGIDIPVRLPEFFAGVRRTLRFEVLALWALCALMAVAGIGVVGQALARQVYVGAEDHPTLRSLGMSRRQLAG